jgi:hypothetical protein
MNEWWANHKLLPYLVLILSYLSEFCLQDYFKNENRIMNLCTDKTDTCGFTFIEDAGRKTFNLLLAFAFIYPNDKLTEYFIV